MVSDRKLKLRNNGTMKKAIVLLLASLFAFNMQAEDEKAWSLSLDQGIYDKYVWRGIQFNQEGVNQGSIDFSYDTGDYGTFGVNYWYNLDMDDENGSAGQISEADYTICLLYTSPSPRD